MISDGLQGSTSPGRLQLLGIAPTVRHADYLANWLDVLREEHGLPARNVHVMPSPADGMSLEDAAAWYGQQLDQTGGDEPFRTRGQAFFDVLLLGVGPDAHVASLFPGHPDSAATGVWTTAVDDSPKPPPLRVSFTMEVIRSADQVWLVASGESKAEALAAAVEVYPEHVDAAVEDLEGEPLDVPAGWATGRSATRWFLDEAAASRLGG